MKIEFESLRKFARKLGDVRFYSPKGEGVILKDGTEDFHAVIEHADTFVVGGKTYTRPEFEKLLDSELDERQKK